MKLIAALVDEMPKGCGDCEYVSHSANGRDCYWRCSLASEVKWFARRSGYDIYEKRLPHCPLIPIRDWYGEKLSELRKAER